MPPDVWIVASDMLFHYHQVFGKPSLLIIDEAFWKKSLRGIERVVQLPWPDWATAAKFRGALVYQLLMQTEDGGLQRRYIEHMSTVEPPTRSDANGPACRR